MISFTYDFSNYSAYKSIKIMYQETNSLRNILYLILAYIDVKYLITHKLLILF